MSKVGTCAKTNNSSRLWLCKPIEDSAAKKKRKQKDTVIHPIFEKLATKIEDQTWKDIFSSASYGKFPKGFGCNGEVLFFQRKNKTSSLNINEENSDDLINSCKRFFRNMGGITSEQEQMDNSQEESTDGTENSPSPVILYWSKLGSEYSKSSYLNRYLHKFAKKNKLDKISYDYLDSLMNLAQCIGLLTDDNVILKDGYIDEIKELYVDNGEVVFLPLERPIVIKRKKQKPKVKESTKKFIKLWDKYISLYEPNIKDQGDEKSSSSISEKKVVTLRSSRKIPLKKKNEL